MTMHWESVGSRNISYCQSFPLELCWAIFSENPLTSMCNSKYQDEIFWLTMIPKLVLNEKPHCDYKDASGVLHIPLASARTKNPP